MGRFQAKEAAMGKATILSMVVGSNAGRLQGTQATTTSLVSHHRQDATPTRDHLPESSDITEQLSPDALPLAGGVSLASWIMSLSALNTTRFPKAQLACIWSAAVAIQVGYGIRCAYK
jgi:hypothetical protein